MITRDELIDLATYVVRQNPYIHLNNLIQVFENWDKSIKSSTEVEKVCDMNCIKNDTNFCNNMIYDHKCPKFSEQTE